MANSINFIQINANHSFTASEHLKINQQLESHITCIQEPYYLKNKIIGFPLTDSIIAQPTKPRVARIIHPKAFDRYTESIQRDYIAVRLSSETIDCILINIYAPPQDTLNHTLCGLEKPLYNFS